MSMHRRMESNELEKTWKHSITHVLNLYSRSTLFESWLRYRLPRLFSALSILILWESSSKSSIMMFRPSVQTPSMQMLTHCFRTCQE
jgi:hypothetical protein